MVKNILILHAHGRIYYQYGLLAAYSLRQSGFNEEILIYCDPKYLNDFKEFSNKFSLDINLKPLNLNSYTRQYGPAYRFCYDVEYWAGNNIYTCDTDMYFYIDRDIFSNYKLHCKAIGMPVSNVCRQIDPFNNRSIKNFLSNIKHTGFLNSLKLALKAPLIKQYRATMNGNFISSELTSSDDFIKLNKKYCQNLSHNPKYNEHFRFFYDETYLYEFYKDLNIFLPIIHDGMLEKLNFTLDYRKGEIYYRPQWGLHMFITRPKKWIGLEKVKPTFLQYENGKKFIINFIEGMSNNKSESIYEFLDDDFSSHIRNSLLEWELLLKEKI